METEVFLQSSDENLASQHFNFSLVKSRAENPVRDFCRTEVWSNNEYCLKLQR